MSYLVATTALPANTGISVALKVMLMHSPLPKTTGALELRKYSNLDYTAMNGSYPEPAPITIAILLNSC
jgi:hypothetical protein